MHKLVSVPTDPGSLFDPSLHSLPQHSTSSDQYRPMKIIIRNRRASKEIVEPGPACLKLLLARQPPVGPHTGLHLKGTEHRQNNAVKIQGRWNKMRKGFLFHLVRKCPTFSTSAVCTRSLSVGPLSEMGSVTPR
jgi:hypothetical protein